jgi:hypothetical protein
LAIAVFQGELKSKPVAPHPQSRQGNFNHGKTYLDVKLLFVKLHHLFGQGLCKEIPFKMSEQLTSGP